MKGAKACREVCSCSKKVKLGMESVRHKPEEGCRDKAFAVALPVPVPGWY